MNACPICGAPADATGYCQRHVSQSPGWMFGKSLCGCMMLMIPLGLGFLLMNLLSNGCK